jgi:serine/threonine protein kinase
MQAVDFWALGVLIYQMLTCETPFASLNDSEIKIYSKITDCEFTLPAGLSADAADLIQKLLVRHLSHSLAEALFLISVQVSGNRDPPAAQRGD